MDSSTPYYLLYCEVGRHGRSHWRFIVRNEDGAPMLEAADEEPDVFGERLELLAVIRGLESLDRPARVTLVNCTPYVRQGIHFGLPDWRENAWRWESFGQMVPVKNADLWQRLDHALQFHRVICQQRRWDGPHATSAPHAGTVNDTVTSRGHLTPRLAAWLKCSDKAIPAAWRATCWAAWRRIRQWLVSGRRLGQLAFQPRLW